MILARSSSARNAQPRLRTQALTVDHPFLYRLTKRLFPGMPRLVRERKMRILCVVSLVVLGLCASLAVVLWLAAHRPPA